MREYVGCPSSPFQVAFVPGDPPRLAAAADRAVYLWSPDRAKPLVLPWKGTAWNAPILEVSADGKWLVTGPAERLRCWDSSADRPGQPRKLFVRGLRLVRFAGRPDRLVVVWHREVRREGLWCGELPVSGGKLVRRTSFHLEPEWFEEELGTSLSDGRFHTLSGSTPRFALATLEQVVLWDSRGGKRAGAIPLRRFKYGLAFSPDGSLLVVNAGTTLQVYDVATRELVSKWTVKYSEFPRLAWSPDSRLVARTDESTTARVYDVATGRQVLAIGPRRGRLVSVAFALDGLTLATGSEDGPVRVWDLG